MDYIISALRIRLPDVLVTGYFQKALEPFAAQCPEQQTPDLMLTLDACPPAGANYREFDRFDFSDADADCRFGCDKAGYLLAMTPRAGTPAAHFRATQGTVEVPTDYRPEEHHPALLRFGLWTTFNLLALRHQTVALHSSVNVYRGQAVLFLGESGTGKSTHTRLWRKHIAGVTLLNDDSPFVTVQEGEAVVSGSPWSGKTPCYINRTYPIRAIVRLSQAPHNRMRRLRPIEAIGALLPSCPPAFARDTHLQDAMCEVVSRILSYVPVYHLECLPDAAAAQLACETIFGDSTSSNS